MASACCGAGRPGGELGHAAAPASWQMAASGSQAGKAAGGGGSSAPHASDNTPAAAASPAFQGDRTWPDREVPAARKVTGTPCFLARGRILRTSSSLAT